MISPSIAILDYGIGNVKSISNGFRKVGIRTRLTQDPGTIASSDGCVLPGVGAFAFGMKSLQRHHLMDSIEKFVSSGKPFLGICLGMQLLFDESDEFGCTKGLGLVPGRVEKLNAHTTPALKLPHVCWNNVIEPSPHKWGNSMLATTKPKEDVYFVHSYAARPASGDHVLSLTRYEDLEFCSSVMRQNVMGVQFHPEKSGRAGLRILQQFASLCSGELP